MQDKKQAKKSGKSSYAHLFHVNIETLYQTFIHPNFLPLVFFKNTKLVSMERNTSMADEGNKITLNLMNKYTFTFLVEKCVNEHEFKSFTHKCIQSPPTFATYTLTFNFYWDSVEKNTAFQVELDILDSLYKNSVSNFFFNHFSKASKAVEEYFATTLTSIDQVESISINKNISEIWGFLKDYNNIRYFFGYFSKSNNNISVKYEENSKEVVVNDTILNNVLRLKVSYGEEESEIEKEVTIEVISSEIKVPKQSISVILSKIDNESTFMRFKHKLLQYLDSDVIGSYKSLKQKALWEIKKEIEGSN